MAPKKKIIFETTIVTPKLVLRNRAIGRTENTKKKKYIIEDPASDNSHSEAKASGSGLKKIIYETDDEELESICDEMKSVQVISQDEESELDPMSDYEDINELNATVLEEENEEEDNFCLQLEESEAWKFGTIDENIESEDELKMSETTHRKPKACFKGYYYTVDKPDGRDGK